MSDKDLVFNFSIDYATLKKFLLLEGASMPGRSIVDIMNAYESEIRSLETSVELLTKRAEYYRGRLDQLNPDGDTE